ncbi:transposable element Tcb2 transposase [Trichonephila clavipes]|nr:transposable element Tcb2 transposase [Trichonephila clavipes]
MLGSRTDLHIFDAGSVNGTRYFNEILLPYVRLFRGAMGLQFLFMDDNAPCHRTVAAEQLLESRRLAAPTLPPITIRKLRLALQDEWAAMPQQLIDTLILSMGRRCETCLAVREIISPTKDRMFLAGHPSHGCFVLQSHCAPCYFFNQASFYPSDFSFSDDIAGLSIGHLWRVLTGSKCPSSAKGVHRSLPRAQNELQTALGGGMEHSSSLYTLIFKAKISLLLDYLQK